VFAQLGRECGKVLSNADEIGAELATKLVGDIKWFLIW